MEGVRRSGDRLAFRTGGHAAVFPAVTSLLSVIGHLYILDLLYSAFSIPQYPSSERGNISVPGQFEDVAV
jgi:hypothetical protein